MTHRQGVSAFLRAVLVLGLSAGWLAGLASDAAADRLTLRGGGQIRGKIVPDPDHADRLTVLTERGKTPLSFQKAQVLEVVPEPSPLDDYVVKRKEATPTAESQYDLGLWCETHKLPDLAGLHYQAALKNDDGYAPAHQKLGHVLHGDRWLTGDELRLAQGLIKYKGKWITRDEKERIDKGLALATEQTSWTRRIRLLREAIVYGTEDRRREAESQLLQIRDPVAVAPLVKVLGEDIDSMRILLARALGGIPGPESSAALVRRLVYEPEPEVRQATMSEVEQLKDASVTRLLVQALRSDSPEVVNRSAWAISNLNALSAVPNLVNALLSTKTEVVMAPSQGGPVDGPNFTATFGSVPPISMMGGTPIAYNGSSVGYLSGPVVGPGVVAYGAYSVPLIPLPNPLPGLTTAPPLSSIGINGGGGLAGSRGPIPRLVSYSIQNVEVLSALNKLTGKNFGYDVSAWKHWLRTSFKAESLPARRVPQP